MLQQFSPIQNHILSTLKNAPSLRYSELALPQKVPNDLFNYHLQFLVQKGFIIKGKTAYSLSEKGIKHLADPITVDAKIASLFKVNVLTILSRTTSAGDIEILNQVRTSHPSFGKIGVPGGIVRKGEGVFDAAKRKLHTETGLEAEFRLVGTERRIMYVKNELFSDVIFPIVYADKYTGTLVDTSFGANAWVPIEQAIKNESGRFDSIQSIQTVLVAIRDGQIDTLPLFYEESVQCGERTP
ncbi:MAG: NUDIX domain-containing protein [Candidatus Taylorbacteria bacterium]|nr:NUDIX domain-containing protein [Candidatus Taylorbacteria bacterium]